MLCQKLNLSILADFERQQLLWLLGAAHRSGARRHSVRTILRDSKAKMAIQNLQSVLLLSRQQPQSKRTLCTDLFFHVRCHLGSW